MSLANKIRFQYDMRLRPLVDPDLRRLRILAQQPYLFPEEDALTHLRLALDWMWLCLLYTSPSPRDRTRSRMPSSA